MQATLEKPVLSNRQRRLQRQRVHRPVEREGMPVVVRPQTMETRHLIEPENLRWFVLQVRSQKEEAFIRVADLIGIPAAIPTVQKQRIRRGKCFRWRAPVASGYVLIGFPGEDRIPWWELHRFEIVHGALPDHQGNPVQVPWECTYRERDGTEYVGGVKTLLPDHDHVRRGAAKYMRALPTFKANEPVRVQDGPFAGHIGRVQDVIGANATILLNILGRQTPAVMAVENIVRAA